MLLQNGPGQDELLCWTVSRCSHLKSHKHPRKWLKISTINPNLEIRSWREKQLSCPRKAKVSNRTKKQNCKFQEYWNILLLCLHVTSFAFLLYVFIRYTELLLVLHLFLLQHFPYDQTSWYLEFICVLTRLPGFHFFKYFLHFIEKVPDFLNSFMLYLFIYLFLVCVCLDKLHIQSCIQTTLALLCNSSGNHF